MKQKCCVPACDSNVKCNICQVGLYYFKTPRDSSMIKKWELALGLKSLKLHDRVCSVHFEKYDIVTKRFICMKRPATNSKMVLEVTKLERYAMPNTEHHNKEPNKRCPHGKGKYKSSSIKLNTKSSRGSSATSEPVSSQSEYTDYSSADDEQRRQKQSNNNNNDDEGQASLSAHKEMANRSKRRQIRALTDLQAKWVDKKKNMAKEIRLIEARIAEFSGNDKESFGSE